MSEEPPKPPPEMGKVLSREETLRLRDEHALRASKRPAHEVDAELARNSTGTKPTPAWLLPKKKTVSN